MTDSRKLTDNELEQVAGGFDPDDFPIGSFVKSHFFDSCPYETVFRIESAPIRSEADATAFSRVDNTTSAATGISVNLNYVYPVSKPDWVD